jgi:cellulose synthase/poly-beta-1,6-N-acetylglucosamine synthase-like glycosyltransferase
VRPTFEIIFWTCVLAIAYNYVGYPIALFFLGLLAQAKSDLAFLLTRKNRRYSERSSIQPLTAIIMSAFNEQPVIEARLRNLLEINYTPSRLEILIGLDAPTDATPEIAGRFRSSRVQVFHFPTRRGKLAVISDLARRTKAEILVFTDANTMFEPNCVGNLIRHFVDPKVGAVSGEEIRTTKAGTDPAAESLYWRYESAMKILESRSHCLHSANGSVYAIRRDLFSPRLQCLVEDFQVPLEVRFRGYRVVYDPEAIGVEEIAPTFASQFERRVRLGAGNFQTLFSNPGYLSPFKGIPAFAYWSHRVLRWLTPCLLIAAFGSSACLIVDLTYRWLFLSQCVFYGLALVGYVYKKGDRSPVLFCTPWHFCSMNMAMVFGLVRYLSGNQSVAWTVTPRETGTEIVSTTSSTERRGAFTRV